MNAHTPDDAGIVLHVRGVVQRVRINGVWHEGDPYHRFEVTSGEFDAEARVWNVLPQIRWQPVAREDWGR